MNGQNGHCNNDSFSHPTSTTWTVGLLNSSLKYLTAETFGFKVKSHQKFKRKKMNIKLIKFLNKLKLKIKKKKIS